MVTCTLTGLTTLPDITWSLASGTYRSEIDGTNRAEGRILIKLNITSLTEDMEVVLTIVSPDGNNQNVNINVYLTGGKFGEVVLGYSADFTLLLFKTSCYQVQVVASKLSLLS